MSDDASGLDRPSDVHLSSNAAKVKNRLLAAPSVVNIDSGQKLSWYRGTSVDLYINSVCNLQCSTCFLGDNYFQTGRQMTVSDVRRILGWCVMNGIYDAAFLGGEPTLHPDLLEMLAVSKQLGIHKNRLITNGSRVSHKFLDSELHGLVDVVYISLDGATSGSNDAVRGNGSFSQSMKGIRLAGRVGIPFVITCSVTSNALNELDSILELAEESGCSVLNIHWVSPTGRAKDQNLTLAPAEWVAFCDAVSQYTPKRADLEVHCQVAYVNRSSSSTNSNIDSNACAVREHENLQFMPDGSVYSCGLLVDQPGLNGYVFDGHDVVNNDGVTELALCAEHEGLGCPIRGTVVPEPHASMAEDFLPVCIYQRIINAGT